MQTSFNELPVVENHPELPTVIVQVQGGIVNCLRSDGPVHIIILDSDVEGGDEDNISVVDGNEVYVSEYLLTEHTNTELGVSDGIDVEFVESVLQKL